MWESTTFHHGHDFIWTDKVAGNLEEASFVRIALKGTKDAYLAFSEEKERRSKMITVVIGGWNNGWSVINWLEKDSRAKWSGNPGEPHSYQGKIFKGTDVTAWLEFNWNVEGK